MKVTTVTCDICGAFKGATNHWFMGYFNPELRDTEAVYRWVEKNEDKANISHLCGESCVQKWVSQCLPKLAERT